MMLVELLLEAAVAGGGRRSPLEPEGRHGHLPAVVDPAHDVVPGTPGVGEEDLVELGRAVDLLDGADLDAGLLHGHEEVGDAGVLVDVGVGAGQEEDVVGELGLGGPDLLAGDDPLVAVGHGPGLERGQVAAGVGLGEPLAPRDGAVQDPGDELPLLLLRAPLQDGRARPGCRRRSRPASGRSARANSSFKTTCSMRRQALAAVLLRPARRRSSPPGEELLGPLGVERLALARASS